MGAGSYSKRPKGTGDNSRLLFVEAVYMVVRRPVGTVETFDQQLVRTVLDRDNVIVCQADTLDCRLALVGDLLVGNPEAVDIHKSLERFPQGTARG